MSLISTVKYHDEIFKNFCVIDKVDLVHQLSPDKLLLRVNVETRMDNLDGVKIQSNAVISSAYKPIDSNISGRDKTFYIEILVPDNNYFWINATLFGEEVNHIYNYYIPSKPNEVMANIDSSRQLRTMGWIDDHYFNLKGFQDAMMINMITEKYYPTIDKHSLDILDFGCGAGRVTRHLRGYKSIFGCDIDQNNVNFCEKNWSNATFFSNNKNPPLIDNENKFDVIFAFSVFTHLSEVIALEFLKELHARLNNNGLLIISVMSYGALAWAGSSDAGFLNRLEKNGIDFESLNNDLVDFGISSDYYRNTYHTREYIENNYGRIFNILDYIPYRIGYQDIVVMKK